MERKYKVAAVRMERMEGREGRPCREQPGWRAAQSRQAAESTGWQEARGAREEAGGWARVEERVAGQGKAGGALGLLQSSPARGRGD